MVMSKKTRKKKPEFGFVRLPVPLHRRLKQVAAYEGKTLAEVTNGIFERYIAGWERAVAEFVKQRSANTNVEIELKPPDQKPNS